MSYYVEREKKYIWVREKWSEEEEEEDDDEREKRIYAFAPAAFGFYVRTCRLTEWTCVCHTMENKKY